MKFSSLIYEHLPWGFVLALFLLFVKVNAKPSDLHVSCPEKMGKSRFVVHSHVTPYGNDSAGHYIKVKDVNTLMECVSNCCLDTTCNVVFFIDDVCLHIQCQSRAMCEPLDRIGNKFDKSYMVIIRIPGEELWDKLVTKQHLELTENLPHTSNYFVPDASAFEDSLEDKDVEDSNDLDHDNLKSDIFETTIENLYATKLKSCMYGIEIICSKNEECVPKNKRSRSGLCQCKKGYFRDNSGRCQRDLSEFSQTKVLSINSSIVQSVPMSNHTTTPVSSTTAAPSHLVVSAGNNITLRLPENAVTLSAYALQQDDKEKLKYEWKLVSQPEGDESGTMESQNTKNLKLSKLRTGIYTFKVTVTGNNAVGDATVNVTVLPPERPNEPPVAIIQPSNVTIKLPNKDTVLDGSFSTDDDGKIVKYQWEVQQVPIGYSVQLNETPTLQLKDLVPGFYRLKLIVTDTKGATNFTFANVTVQKETDYPPTANAKSETVIYLPQNEVFLNGNMSTDDKGIKSWEWKKSQDTDKAVDMEGTNTPYLHLSNLQVGVYKFILKVTDTADQTSTTEVHLFVKPESNTPPIAITGPDIRVTLPLKNPVSLDGSQSKDDIKIIRYHWEQTQGPKTTILIDADSAVAKADGLGPGYFQFKLTVLDDKNTSSSALLNVTVIQTQNIPPRANAGGDKTVYLPCDVVTMNGSGSTDDVGIVKYRWTRDAASLAAGTILENSDQTAVLKLTRLISGRYLFRLTVSDLQGTSSSDTASLIVKPPPSLMDQLEVMVNADIKSFTQGQEETILRQLEMLLHVGDPVKIRLVKLDSDRNTRRVIMVFVVEKAVDMTPAIVPGAEVVSRLKRKLRTDSALLDLEILSLDTVVCQNQCSGHGSCDQYTKRCICEAFWMQDVFRRYLGDRESNCDWSILYVIIVSFTVVVLLAGVIWGAACCWTRMRFRKPKKRHRYTLLEDFGEREREREKFIPRSKLTKSSLMLSESDSDAIFESQRKPTSNAKLNGTPNGLVRSPHKVTA